MNEAVKCPDCSAPLYGACSECSYELPYPGPFPWKTALALAFGTLAIIAACAALFYRWMCGP